MSYTPTAYPPPPYHGGMNHPEQVTDHYLNFALKPVPPPPGRAAPRLGANLFYDTQVDRLLRRHNKDRGRDDTLYNIRDYCTDGYGRAQHLKRF